MPAYDGPYTMEDIRKVMWNTTVGRDFCYCVTDVEEIMRRVPGITRKGKYFYLNNNKNVSIFKNWGLLLMNK